MPDTNQPETGQTARLVTFVADTSAAQIPADVRALMRLCLLDFVGNTAFAAMQADSSDAIRQGIDSFYDGAPGSSTVIGETQCRSLPAALILNGTYAHSMDFDDTNFFGKLHPGVVVITATLAEAERCNATGSDLITALAIGYEVACRVGASLGEETYSRGFHPTPIGGIFGAIAALARLRGLNAGQISAAFGLAGSRAAGSMQYLENGAWNKRLHSGFAAHDALLCLSLATANVLGAAEALEGRAGVLQAYSPAPDAEKLVQGLGVDWVAGSTAIKPFPCCRLIHSPIEAALIMRERSPADPLGHYCLRIDPTSYRLVGEPHPNKLNPKNIVDGQFSAYFHVAVSLLEGCNNWDSYQLLGNDAVNILAGQIEIIADDSFSVGRAVLSNRDAPQNSVEILEPLGELSRPLSWDDVLAKYTSNAAPVLGQERAASLAEKIHSIEACDALAPVIALAQRPL